MYILARFVRRTKCSTDEEKREAARSLPGKSNEKYQLSFQSVIENLVKRSRKGSGIPNFSNLQEKQNIA